MSTYLVIMLLMDTPVPIPNTKVKQQEADSTARETLWEGRRSPGINAKDEKHQALLGVLFFISKKIRTNNN